MDSSYSILPSVSRFFHRDMERWNTCMEFVIHTCMPWSSLEYKNVEITVMLARGGNIILYNIKMYLFPVIQSHVENKGSNEMKQVPVWARRDDHPTDRPSNHLFPTLRVFRLVCSSLLRPCYIPSHPNSQVIMTVSCWWWGRASNRQHNTIKSKSVVHSNEKSTELPLDVDTHAWKSFYHPYTPPTYIKKLCA